MELFNCIDTILFEDWDPISVNDIAPSDEYRGYAPEICEKFARNESLESIAKHLHSPETKDIAIIGDYSHCLEIAHKILELKLIM